MHDRTRACRRMLMARSLVGAERQRGAGLRAFEDRTQGAADSAPAGRPAVRCGAREAALLEPELSVGVANHRKGVVPMPLLGAGSTTTHSVNALSELEREGPSRRAPTGVWL